MLPFWQPRDEGFEPVIGALGHRLFAADAAD
jgi:hypothetical protein